MIDKAVRCAPCGTQGVGNCECWARCATCGHSYARGKKHECGAKGPLVATHFGNLPAELSAPARKERKR